MPLIGRAGDSTDSDALLADALRRIRRLEKRKGGLDPNEDPVIIGSGASTTDGGTPSNPGGSAFTHLVIIGNGASGNAGYQIAIGSGATTSGDSTVAIGVGADTSADSATAVGETTSASGLRSSAFGTSSQAFNDDALALGPFASAGGVRSVAIGKSASTTTDDMIMLGTAGHFTEISWRDATYGSIIVMQSPNHTRYALQVSNAGVFSVIASPV